MRKKVTVIVLIFLWVVSRNMKAYSSGDADLQNFTAEKVVYSDEADWYKNGKAEFAINIFDEEWKALYTQDEMIAACQIPDKILDKLTTAELLKLTEEYPLLSNMYGMDTIEEGFQYIVSSFNGLQELLTREDCLEAVCEEYCNLVIPEEEIMDFSSCRTEEQRVTYANEILEDEEMLKTALDDTKPLIICDLLELIMLDKTTDDNIEMLLDIVVDKAEEKESAECFGFANKSIYISEMDENMLSDISAYMAAETSGTTKKLYWKGVAIDVLVENNPKNITQEDAVSRVAPYQAQGASIVYLGTTKYNCHSYAWLRFAFPTTYDDYGLNIVPDVLMDACTKYSEPHKQSIAYTVGHSAVIVDATHISYIKSKLEYDPIVKAKWGYYGPVVKAPMNVGMYGMSHDSIEHYYYYGSVK